MDQAELNIPRTIDLELRLLIDSDNSSDSPLVYDWESTYQIVDQTINAQSYVSVEAFLETLYSKIIQEKGIKEVQIKLFRDKSNVPAYYHKRCPNLKSITFEYP
jgi:hypothetical protein